MATKDLMRQGTVLAVSKRGFHRIAYTDWGDCDADQVVVCVHGLTRQGRDFDRLALALAERGFRVVCPDLAGRGRSDWLDNPDDYNLPQYVMDMTVLIGRLGVSSIHWVGTSLGALVGMVMAGQNPSPIRNLVVNDIGPTLSWSALTRIGAYLSQQPRTFPDLASARRYFREALLPYGPLSDADWLHLTEHSVKELADGRHALLCDPAIAHAFRPIWANALDLWRYWEAIRAPVLILRGEHSDMLPRETAEAMIRRGTKAELMELPNCGHAPALLDTMQVNLVADWLTRAAYAW
jgi:pimeloyl-ACP methyl ester carboxylesterase